MERIEGLQFRKGANGLFFGENFMKVMKAHLFGTPPYVDSVFLNADELSYRCGGNTGNLLFSYSLSQILSTGLTSVPWHADISNLNPGCDCLVLPLANQLGPHVDLTQLAEMFSKVPIPMVAVGLGAQGPISGVDPQMIPEGSWKFLESIISHAPSDKPNVALRGDITMQVVSAKGFGDHCVVTGCPSNFINSSASLGREIYRRRANGFSRVAVAAGNPFLPQFRRLEQSLVAMVEDSDGIYVCQHPIGMLRLVKQEYESIERDKFLKYKEYIRPGLSIDAFLGWFRRYGYAFSSVPEWLTTMKRYDLVVGTRIHGVMAGIQAGVPGVCLCIDSRTLELCRTMAIPHVDANDYREGITKEQLAEVLRKWDWRYYDETRRVLAERLRAFLQSNRLKTYGALEDILKKRSQLSVMYNAKQNYSAVHQVSTASIDDRYATIFSALNRVLNMPAPRVLSFGCSDGFEPLDLATKYFHHGHIVGFDIDKEAIRIARLCNNFPARVTFVEGSLESLKVFQSFDAVVAMSVLCRWPETREMDDIGEFYPFDKFDETVDFLVSLLRPGGILCIYNANYIVSETSAMKYLEVINDNSIPKKQQVKLFHRNGRPLEVQELSGVIFRKRIDG